MTILKHDRIFRGRKILHTVNISNVSDLKNINIESIAVTLLYDPSSYGMYDPTITTNSDNSYTITWNSFNSCD